MSRSLAEFEDAARDALDPATWAWLAGGAADETTLADNLRAWRELRLWPRGLRPLAQGHTRVELLGRTLAHPILLAPLAHQRLLHPDGERASALAAATQGAGFVMSLQASVEPEAVAGLVRDEPGRGPLWHQLHWPGDRGAARALAERVEACGFEAIVLTIDAAVQGPRDRERRAGFRLPPDAAAIRFASPPPSAEGLCGGLLRHAPTWDDVDWLRAHVRLPLLLKGVLHPADAREARSRGVAGLIVSNHGGRALDTVPATAWALPRIAEAIDGALPLLVDGGIRRGTDVLKALALGARAVLIGRPAAHGLAVAGAIGVAQVLRRLRDELEIALAATGCACPSQARAELLFDTRGGPR